jgi:CubicO group peptidase (beta-lactamase class C family)
MGNRSNLTRLAVVLAAVALVGAGCTGPTGSTTPPSSAPSAEPGLFVADTDEARQAADVVQSVFESEHLGSVIIGVWRDGDPIVVGALGESMAGVPATVDMHHRTGNIGHSMTTTVLLQQVEKGTLALDDKLSEYLPDVPGADQVTLDELAHSTTGYPHFPSDPEFQPRFYADPFADFPVDDLVTYGTQNGTQFEPGTDWQFSDTNILLLGLALEKATGESMEQLVREGILDPLGMDDTTSYLSPDLDPPVLHSYTDERGPWEEGTFWNPSWIQWIGGWGSNQDDIRTFIEAIGTGSLVSPASHEAQLAPVNVGLGTNTDARYYAMGISIVNDWLLTAPGLQGLHASIGYLPSQKLTVVIYFTRTPEYDVANRSTLIFEPLSSIIAPENAVDLG